jgi:hypothetical protein
MVLLACDLDVILISWLDVASKERDDLTVGGAGEGGARVNVQPPEEGIWCLVKVDMNLDIYMEMVGFWHDMT